MANKTRAQMIDRAMQRMGVLGAGVSAAGEDAVLVGETLDGIHDELTFRGLIGFASTSYPEWAQDPIAQIVAATAGPYFGVYRDPGLRDAEIRRGEASLARNVQGPKALRVTPFRDF